MLYSLVRSCLKNQLPRLAGNTSVYATEETWFAFWAASTHNQYKSNFSPARIPKSLSAGTDKFSVRQIFAHPYRTLWGFTLQQWVSSCSYHFQLFLSKDFHSHGRNVWAQHVDEPKPMQFISYNTKVDRNLLGHKSILVSKHSKETTHYILWSILPRNSETLCLI